MARWNDLPWRDDVYAAADIWKERCLLQDKALFSDQDIWTLENIEALYLRLQDLQTQKGKFCEKLENQLKGAESKTVQLAAEVIYVIYLCPLGKGIVRSNGDRLKPSIRAQKKREKLQTIFSFGGLKFPPSSLESSKFKLLLEDKTLSGLCNVGPALASIHTMILHQILFLLAWKSLLSENQHEYLRKDNAWVFGQWFDENVTPENNQLMRNQILHLLFPDHFERVIAKDDKNGFLRSVIDNTDFNFVEPFQNPMNIDRALYESRPYIQGQLNILNFDFYVHHDIFESWIERCRETANFADIISKLNDGIDQAADYLANAEGAILDGVLEGKRKIVAHAIMERRSQRKEKIREFKAEHGELFCECCCTRSETYPTVVRYRTFEVHHLVPLAKLKCEKNTRLADLAVLCANCHRAIHTFSPSEMPSIEEFRSFLEG